MIALFIISAWIFLLVDGASDYGGSSSGEEPVPKRIRRSSTISFHVDNTNDPIGIREQNLKATNSFVISSTQSDHANSYYSTTDLAVQSAMTYLHIWSSQNTRKFDALDVFLQSARLHKVLALKAFADLGWMCVQQCHLEVNGVKRRLRVRLEFITKLKEYVISGLDQVDMGEFQKSLKDDPNTFLSWTLLGFWNEKDTFLSWTILGFWKSFLKHALEQQMQEMVQQSSHQLRERNARLRMISMVQQIWEKMKDAKGLEVDCGDNVKPIAAVLTESYSILERIAINYKIRDAVRKWRRDHDGSIAVVLKEPPMEFLKDDLRDMGYAESDISVSGYQHFEYDV